MTYDFIGDIHGHADRLQLLLEKLGYRLKNGVYGHSDGERIAVFLGDYIDRGPAIRKTLEIVRAMTDAKRALAIMGNHEYNAICFHIQSPAGTDRWMRSRNDKNVFQYVETLYQFKDHREELAEYIEWFKSLPLWLDLGGARAVHAAWHTPSIETVSPFPRGGRFVSDKLLRAASVRGSEEYQAVEILLKGIEINLPEGFVFTDQDGNPRSKMRVRWWLNAAGKTYGELTFREHGSLKDVYPEENEITNLSGYAGEEPVFFGHYWFKDDRPLVLGPRVACLDYSVASGGFLAAYTWQGESELSGGNFTTA